MLVALIVALIAESAGFLFYLDRLTSRHDKQTNLLLQRIQAPETAVAQAVILDQQPVQHLPFNDDEAWMKYIEEQGRG